MQLLLCMALVLLKIIYLAPALITQLHDSHHKIDIQYHYQYNPTDFLHGCTPAMMFTGRL